MIISVNSTGLIIIIAGALSYTPNWAPSSTPKSGGKSSYFMDGLGRLIYYTNSAGDRCRPLASIFVGQCPIDEPGCWPALCRRLFELCRLHHLYPISESFGQCPNFYNETTLWMRDDYNYSYLALLNYNCDNSLFFVVVWLDAGLIICLNCFSVDWTHSSLDSHQTGGLRLDDDDGLRNISTFRG